MLRFIASLLQFTIFAEEKLQKSQGIHEITDKRLKLSLYHTLRQRGCGRTKLCVKRQYSLYTPADFCGDLKKFRVFLHRKPLEEITSHDIRACVSPLCKQMTDKTSSWKLSALNNFFTWLVGEKVLEVNPTSTVPNYKVTSPLPEILFDTEYSQLLAATSHDCRNYLLIMLLLETGSKTEEVMNLYLSHIDVSNKYTPEMWVKHSGKKVKKR